MRFLCVCARHGVDTGHGQNPERVGAIVCIWVVRLPLWLTNNGNWPCRAGPGWGRVGSVAIATGQDTQDDTAPTALSGLPRAAKPPTARRTGALNFPARRKRECQHSWACDIEYWLFMRFRFGVLSLAPL